MVVIITIIVIRVILIITLFMVIIVISVIMDIRVINMLEQSAHSPTTTTKASLTTSISPATLAAKTTWRSTHFRLRLLEDMDGDDDDTHVCCC